MMATTRTHKIYWITSFLSDAQIVDLLKNKVKWIVYVPEEIVLLRKKLQDAVAHIHELTSVFRNPGSDTIPKCSLGFAAVWLASYYPVSSSLSSAQFFRPGDITFRQTTRW